MIARGRRLLKDGKVTTAEAFIEDSNRSIQLVGKEAQDLNVEGNGRGRNRLMAIGGNEDRENTFDLRRVLRRCSARPELSVMTQ